MRRPACLTAVLLLSFAGRALADDAHAEMAAALEMQADVQPGPPVVPTLSSARPATLTAAAAVERSRQPPGLAIARAAQAASEAAEQAQAVRAKARAAPARAVHLAL